MYAAFLDALRKDIDLSYCWELSWLLGCKVEQDRKAGTVRLTQEKYCNDILKRFQAHREHRHRLLEEDATSDLR